MHQKQHSPIKRKGNHQLEKKSDHQWKNLKCHQKIKQSRKYGLLIDSNYNYIVISMVGESKMIFQVIF
jgi:hypothetical protein